MELLDNAIFVMFMSFLVGMIGNAVLRRHASYQWLSTRYLFRNPHTYELLGVGIFKALMLKTPLGNFNRKLVVTADRRLKTLLAVRSEMASAEISHWLGLIAMLTATGIAWFLNRHPAVIGSHLLFNLFGNVYPALLQQYNKRRLEHLITLTRGRSKAAPDR